MYLYILTHLFVLSLSSSMPGSRRLAAEEVNVSESVDLVRDADVQ